MKFHILNDVKKNEDHIKQKKALAIIASLKSVGTFISGPDPDPCRSHYEENVWQRSTRHKMNARDFSRCDTRLTVDWYRFTSRAGGKIPHRRIQPGYCGMLNP